MSETRLVPYTSICLLGMPAASDAISAHRHGPCHPTSPPRGEALALRIGSRILSQRLHPLCYSLLGIHTVLWESFLSPGSSARDSSIPHCSGTWWVSKTAPTTGSIRNM